MKNILSGYIIVVLVSFFLLALNGCMQTSYTYGVVGNPAISENGEYIVVLVAESKATSKQENISYWSTNYNSSYWLKLYETATGKFIKKKKIVSSAEQNNTLPLCYGGYADKIWLHTTGLKAYDINTLEEVVDQEKLAKQNSFDINNFPDDQRFIDEMVADGYIRFRGIDGNKYRLDIAGLKIQNETDRPVNAIEKMNESLHKQQYLAATFGVRCDTLKNKMWILAKDSTTALGINPNNAEDRPVYSRLKLFTIDYTINGIGSHRFYRSSNLVQLSGLTYINGILLKDFNNNKVIRLQNPGLYIILHNDSLSSNSRAILTAIDKNNNSIWQINTGLNSRINNCIVKGNYCFISGNKEYLIGPHVGSDMLCIINTATGKMKRISIEE